MRDRITRRRFLRGIGLATAAAWHPSVVGGLLRAPPAAAQSLPRLPSDFGRGRTVVVIGAGIAGLVSAYELLRAGFSVRVLEGEARYGGRSLTVRPADPAYRDWFLSTQPFVRADSYCDHVPAESRGTRLPRQDAAFVPVRWGEGYVDLYFNAGPGRLPLLLDGVIHYCRTLGVALEPYTFAAESNLLQSESLDGGAPVQLRQYTYDLQGHLAALLRGAEGPGLAALGPTGRALLDAYLTAYGALSPDGRYLGSDRSGYVVVPGAGDNAGQTREPLPLEELLEARNLWADGLGDEAIDWQLPLLQRVGGMDMIWQALLAERIDGRELRDRVDLGHAVTAMGYAPGGDGIVVTYRGAAGEGVVTADHVIMTGKPPLLLDMDLADLLAPDVRAMIGAILFRGGGKYGWQARSRFWERNPPGIFGGISYTTHLIDQIWYPSSGFAGPTGILTGAYVRDLVYSDREGRFYQGDGAERREVPAAALDPNLIEASRWAALDANARTQAALRGGSLIHPTFADEVYADRGISVSWNNQPFQHGLSCERLWETAPAVYARLVEPVDRLGRLYLAGDTTSYWQGWQEGVVRSTWWTIERLKAAVERTRQ